MSYFDYPGVEPSNRTSSQGAQPGLNHAPEYMVSGLPFVTASALTVSASKIELPYVSSELSFHATGGAIRFGFTENGVNGSNYFLVGPGEGLFRFDIRCKTIYVRGDAGAATMTMAAALTQIDRDRYPLLTGSLADPITGKQGFNTGSLDFAIGYNGLG